MANVAPALASDSVSIVLDRLGATPAQAIAIRKFLNQYDAGYTLKPFTNADGYSAFTLADSETGAFRGEYALSAGDGGSIKISRTTGAELDLSAKFTLPILLSPSPTEKIFTKGDATTLSKETGTDWEQKADGSLGAKIELPVIDAKAGGEYGQVTQSVASFGPDGSGYDVGIQTSLANVSISALAKAEGSLTSDSASGGVKADFEAGAKGPSVTGFGTLYGPVTTDSGGAVGQGSIVVKAGGEATLADLALKFDCSTSGCATKTAAGLLGVGATLEYEAKSFEKIATLSRPELEKREQEQEAKDSAQDGSNSNHQPDKAANVPAVTDAEPTTDDADATPPVSTAAPLLAPARKSRPVSDDNATPAVDSGDVDDAPSADDNSDDSTPSADDNSDDSTPSVDDNSDDSTPSADDNSDGTPSADDNSDDGTPSADDNSNDSAPSVDDNSNDGTPSADDSSDDDSSPLIYNGDDDDGSSVDSGDDDSSSTNDYSPPPSTYDSGSGDSGYDSSISGGDDEGAQ